VLNSSTDARTPGPRRTATRIVFSWPVITVGAFDCWPDDERWRSENLVDEGHVIAFPGTAVEIAQDGHHPVVTDPNQVVLYNRNQSYRRRLVSSSGDHCTYLIVAPELLGDLAAAGSTTIRDLGQRPFSFPVLPITRFAHLEHRRIVHRLFSDRETDPLELQERLVRLVGRALQPASAASATRRHRRAGTDREHRRLVEDARALLAADVGRALSLEQLARGVGASVFHVSRVFRERVGMSLHAYRDELRLRSALPEVLDGSRSLTEIALDHGYASPSHFTDRFRARYGMAPSALRSATATAKDMPAAP
jgi:AraC family transcriptional regulator